MKTTPAAVARKAARRSRRTAVVSEAEKKAICELKSQTKMDKASRQQPASFVPMATLMDDPASDILLDELMNNCVSPRGSMVTGAGVDGLDEMMRKTSIDFDISSN